MKRALVILVLLGLLLAFVPVSRSAAPVRQADDPVEEQIDQIIASLNPKERVGQLMLITFEGSKLGPETAVARLIQEYNIGGVVLLAANDNINGQVNTPRLVLSLTTELQRLVYANAQATSETPRAAIPLFVATAHAGNGQPGTQIATGTTALPGLMALGATWNSSYVRQVGQIAGAELSAMGINMLLGPSLDVAQQTQTDRTLDLGVDTFGSEPYWVGKLGQAYITGVHEGGQGRLAVIAQHFPGLGFADTQPDVEIPVVPRSVEELRQFDLVPFVAVTSGAGDSAARADGIQCANIRYQGENIRSITRPVCLDEQAAGQLLSLADFQNWRDQGIMISSPLGTRAIRRYYDVSPFPHRQVAREAFLAGSDLLYLADFGPEHGADQFENVTDVIRFFAELYDDDPVFRAQVDASLRRILRLKLSLYSGDLSLDHVLHPPTSVDAVGSAGSQLYTIAQSSVTLLAPRRESLPPPPSRDENMVIFTDVRLVQQCSYCAAYTQVSVNALEVAIERRYGPYADAQIRPEQVVSFSFSQLQSYLEGDVNGLAPESNEYRTNQRIAEALRDADWIVFVMLDVLPEIPSSSIVRHLLQTDSSIVERSRVVVMALGAPIYLSSTEISRFAAYYGLYSSIPAYVDAAARALFQESSYPGALPISLPAAGYDVLEMTAPDSTQTIQIEVDAFSGQLEVVSLYGADLFTMQTGDQVTLRTRPILDRNGHVVPDGTPVEFTVVFVTDNLQTRQYGTTQNGIAYTDFKPVRPGRVQISAASVDTTRSMTFQIMVVDGVSALQPPATATIPESTLDGGTPPPGTPVAQVLPLTPGADTIFPVVESEGDEPESRRRVEPLDLVVTLFGLALMGTVGFFAGRAVTATMSGGVRVLLGGVVAGLTGYIYYGLGGPGALEIYNLLDHLAPVTAALSTGMVGLLSAWWMLRRE